jgi:gliding motility-associated-like protein
MKKYLLIILIGFFSFNQLLAAHIEGGEIYYAYLGAGSAPNTARYRITLRLFRDNFNSNPMAAPLPGSAPISIFDAGSMVRVRDINVPRKLPALPNLALTSPSPCILNPPSISFQVNEYETIEELPLIAPGYIVAYQRCCRADNLENLGAASMVGASYIAYISGTTQVANGQNSSPVFGLRDTALICGDSPFSLDFQAFDPDGDSLAYFFCDAFSGGGLMEQPSVPPFNSSVPYGNGYNSTFPMGNDVNINGQTGLISGTAPPIVSGGTNKYIVCVCIREYRNGVLIGNHRKDFIVKVANCQLTAADLDPTYVFCKSLTVDFQNNTQIPAGSTVTWDFGVPNITTDFSNDIAPSYTYPDTGKYVVKLRVVTGNGQCVSEDSTVLSLYPQFKAGFTETGACFSSPFCFVDTTTTTGSYGTVNFWKWDFGLTTTLADTANIKSPCFTFNAVGTFNVTLIAGTDKGCRDTVIKMVSTIDRPLITLPTRDTLICSIDTLQLNSSSTSGTPTWTPLYNFITSNTIPNPRVAPKVTTTYVVEYNDLQCIGRDSIRVRVVDFVTLNLPNDTTICRTDTITINTMSDALRYIWSPNINIDNVTAKTPKVFPSAPTQTYSVISNIGLCQATDQITITTVPYPNAKIFSDTTICFGGTANLLGVIDGNSFTWSNTTGGNNLFSTLNNNVSPTNTTTYILRAFNTLGCPKPGVDSAVVTVLPKIIPFAGNDTAIVVGQPLQLNATGGTSYLWSPNLFLSNNAIADPISNGLTADQTYIVQVFNSIGCFERDTVKVKVFLTPADIFIPSAFSPNGDGRNDVARPIAVGIKDFQFFSIYNRWGQMVFTTRRNGEGWDGKLRGTLQGNSTFVYVAQGIDYTGRVVKKQGTITLIR